MWAEQAVFTSLVRHGREGYHLVSQSRGVGAADAQSLARWAPSHDALLVDGCNRTSVNFHLVPSGRFAVSRTCAGPPEYSGRGGRQLYTHILIVDHAVMKSAGFHPIAVFRAACALGYLIYQPEPEDVIEPVVLSELYPVRDAAGWAHRAAELGLPPLEPLARQLYSGRPVRFAYSGDRIELAECLIGMLPVEVAINTSFSTSLVPSSDRPFVLTLLKEG